MRIHVFSGSPKGKKNGVLRIIRVFPAGMKEAAPRDTANPIAIRRACELKKIYIGRTGQACIADRGKDTSGRSVH